MKRYFGSQMFNCLYNFLHKLRSKVCICVDIMQKYKLSSYCAAYLRMYNFFGYESFGYISFSLHFSGY